MIEELKMNGLDSRIDMDADVAEAIDLGWLPLRARLLLSRAAVAIAVISPSHKQEAY